MFDWRSDLAMERQPGELNEHQKTRLRVSCQYIDKLLGDVEDVLDAASSPSPFPRYIVDVSPAQIRVLKDYISRIREQLLRTLAWQKIQPEPASIPATRAVLTNLSFIDIAVEELKPKYMRGSGPVPEDAVDELNGVVHELRSILTETERYVKQELTTDLETRLKRLEEDGLDVGALQLLEKIVTRNGLVEFRHRIDALAGRLEDDNFELALFGRVSSGKSSLLNALLGMDVLPVGINPITAIPTRLRYGAKLQAAITYGDGHSTLASIDELKQLVTEQGNPGNLKNIVRAIVEVPAPRLKQGIVLVDTPGLGSLARNGAAETLAYLPSCDLALLLIDAGATLTDEDIGTLRRLYEAGVPALVLLSKADLLAEGDLHRSITYIEEHIQQNLHLKTTVYPVSARASYSILLDHFFERELLPRFEDARALRAASVARKIGTLREAVISTLESVARRTQEDEKRTINPKAREEIDSRLRVITGQIGELQTSLGQNFQRFAESPDLALDAAVQVAVVWARSHTAEKLSPLQLSEWLHEVVQQSIQRPLEMLHKVTTGALNSLQAIAKSLERSDAPDQEDVQVLLRNLPRFEMSALPSAISLNRWLSWSEAMLRSRIRSHLRESIGSNFQEELHLYGMSLREWSDQVIRKLEAVVNSYAEAYRAQLHRLSGTTNNATTPEQARADLMLLKQQRGGDRAVATQQTA